MHAFTDSLGRKWELAINVASAKRVRDLMGVRLYDLIDNGAKGLQTLLGDPILLVEVCYHLCKQAAGLTPDEFFEGFSGDTIEAAADAFFGELVDFFPQPKARESLRKMDQKRKEVQELLLDQQNEKLEALDPVLLAEKLRDSSGSSPGRSASTPAPSPSEK